MHNKIIMSTIAFFIFSGCTTMTVAKPTSQSSTEVPVAWGTDESNLRFARAEKPAFYSLSNQFESQVNKFFCGPTSAVIVLNALRVQNPEIKKPTDALLYRGPQTPFLKMINPVFERYTQYSFFTKETDHVKTSDQVFGVPVVADDPKTRDGGIQLRQLGEMLKVYHLNVDINVVSDDADLTKLKTNLVNQVKSSSHYVIGNFYRKALGEKGGAHISPIAAYDAASDSVLIMDVNTTEFPWVWVKTDTLLHAMQTKDTLENRGYLVISELR